MTARSTSCDGGCGVYTSFRYCGDCQAVLDRGDKLPGREDRFADLRAQVRTVTTPETRRQAPPPVMPALGRHVRATLPTLDAAPLASFPVDRHAAVNRLIGFVTAPDTTDGAIAALLVEAERLKGAA